MTQSPPTSATRLHLDRLRQRLRQLDGALVAFSGGVDSTFLLKVASDELGDRVVAVTARSESLPSHELEEAVELARRMGVDHRIVETREIDRPGYTRNDVDRCYHCKTELFEAMAGLARREGVSHLLYGATADDACDFRPGQRAARELGVLAPLAEVGLGKDAIRRLSAELDLPTWDKPAFACLASRVPFGRPISAELLARIERAESALRDLGFRQYRVRDHGEIARIELEPEDLARAVETTMRTEITTALSAIGWRFVVLDLAGFRSGSLNPDR